MVPQRAPHRIRKIVATTMDTTIRLQLLALAAQHNITLSYAVELVLTRKLDLPPPSQP